MSGNPAAGSRGRVTRLRLAIVAVLTLAVAIGAITTYLVRRDPSPATNAANAVAGPVPSVPPDASTASPATAPHGSVSGVPATPAPAAAAPTVRSPARPDSEVDPDAVFVDPAASAKPAKTPVANDPPRCADWRKRMTAEQRTTYSAALLRAAWQNEGSSATPPGNVALAYRSAITTACAGKSAATGLVADVARAVYASDQKTWGP
jgi:hypothetical protein